MKKTIRLTDGDLRRMVKEALTDYVVANDGGYVSNDGYSMDGLDDARWERNYEAQVAQEWNGFPEDIFKEYDLIPDGTTTPDEVIKGLADDKYRDVAPWCYNMGLLKLYENNKYRKYAKAFARYLITRGGLSEKAEQDEINRLKNRYRYCRNTANNILLG